MFTDVTKSLGPGIALCYLRTKSPAPDVRWLGMQPCGMHRFDRRSTPGKGRK